MIDAQLLHSTLNTRAGCYKNQLFEEKKTNKIISVAPSRRLSSNQEPGDFVFAKVNSPGLEDQDKGNANANKQ